MNNIILAIDLGKYKSVACILDSNGGEFRFTSFETTRTELQNLLDHDPPSLSTILTLHKDGPRTPEGLKQTKPTSLADAGSVRFVFIQVGEAIRRFGGYSQTTRTDIATHSL
jgi:hypothetical protein